MQLELIKGLQPSVTRGKLIVIEGSDGAGKATQLELLKSYLIREHIPVKVIDFPRYHTSFYGKMIAQFLRGKYGELKNIHPHLISVVYAMDRAEAKRQMDRWLDKGDIILANRYVTSNMAHQSSRLPAEEKEEFLKWIEELEYKLNKIPRENIVIYLYIPYKISQELILKKDKQQRTYVKGEARDLVERDFEYLKKSENSYLDLTKRFSHWVMINCIDHNDNLRSKEDIHEELKRILKEKGIIE